MGDCFRLSSQKLPIRGIPNLVRFTVSPGIVFDNDHTEHSEPFF